MSKRNLLMICLISGSSFLFGCESAPESPQVKRCGLVKAESGGYYLYCSDSKTEEKNYLSIDEAHLQGTVCMSVDDYIDVENYINSLIDAYKKKGLK